MVNTLYLNKYIVDQQKKSMSDAFSTCTSGRGALVPVQNTSNPAQSAEVESASMYNIIIITRIVTKYVTCTS
jgi:hypothetical protein